MTSVTTRGICTSVTGLFMEIRQCCKYFHYAF